jgi:hypothetical protein
MCSVRGVGNIECKNLQFLRKRYCFFFLFQYDVVDMIAYTVNIFVSRRVYSVGVASLCYQKLGEIVKSIDQENSKTKIKFF